MATYTTKQQKAVLDCLSERADSPVSAAAIVDALREQGEHIGIATVYRQLEKLERQGSVHKVTTDEGAYYQFCTHGCASDCCLFKCERCGRIVHLDCHQLAPLYEHLEHEHGFSINPRKTMFYGLCRDYDFARAIVGDRADVTLLLSPGREAHSFEPTPLDAVTISESDVFLYNGGEGEYWVDSMLGAAGENIAVIARMMDYVDALDEEYVEGMQGADGHDHDHEHGSHDDHDDHDHDHEEDEHDSDEVEYDEHIWTSPKNAVVLCRAVCDAICKADPANEDFYRANCDDYCAQIEALDARFADLCASTPHKLLVFADRFPMLYFCREFGLDYRAAFHGCSGDTEPSLATIKYLIDKVEDEDIPVVYTIDFGTKKIAAVVSECTGAAVDTLYSMQTVSRADFDAGETYLTLMERNYEALRKGLNE